MVECRSQFLSPTVGVVRESDRLLLLPPPLSADSTALPSISWRVVLRCVDPSAARVATAAPRAGDSAEDWTGKAPNAAGPALCAPSATSGTTSAFPRMPSTDKGVFFHPPKQARSDGGSVVDSPSRPRGLVVVSLGCSQPYMCTWRIRERMNREAAGLDGNRLLFLAELLFGTCRTMLLIKVAAVFGVGPVFPPETFVASRTFVLRNEYNPTVVHFSSC